MPPLTKKVKDSRIDANKILRGKTKRKAPRKVTAIEIPKTTLCKRNRLVKNDEYANIAINRIFYALQEENTTLEERIGNVQAVVNKIYEDGSNDGYNQGYEDGKTTSLTTNHKTLWQQLKKFTQ